MNETSFVNRHSLAIFFILAFGIAWIGSLVLVGPKFFAGEEILFDDIGSMAIVMLSGPFFAGILMTYLSEGVLGLKELFTKMTKFKVFWRWYLPLLIFPCLLLVVALLLGIFVSSELSPIFVVLGIFGGPLAGLFEETGWTGFAYPKMKGKSSAVATAVWLGIIHAVWHIVASFLGSYNDVGSYWALYFFGSSLHIVALRVLIVWVYTNTESVLLAILMHASSTGFFGILISTTMAPLNWAIYYNVYGIVLCAVTLVIGIKYGKTLKPNLQVLGG